MGIAGNEWGFQVGTLPKGARDKISDVPGVTVGHCTLADGVVQTGVTALLPHQGDIFHEKVLAASYVISADNLNLHGGVSYERKNQSSGGCNVFWVFVLWFNGCILAG